MVIVYVNPFFTDGMGYIENCRRSGMAKRGHKVYIISTTGKAYFDQPNYKETYEEFFGPPIVDAGIYKLSSNIDLYRLIFKNV